MSGGNGSHVTRGELGAHIRRIDENIEAIRSDVHEIKEKLASPSRWLSARATRVVDYTLPGVVVGGVVWLATRL